MYLLLSAGLFICCSCSWTCGRHMGTGTSVWWNLCLMGTAAAVGIDMFGPCHLLGMYESQPSYPELLVNPPTPSSSSSPPLVARMPCNLFKGLGRSHCYGHQSEDEILAALRSSTEYDDSTIFKPPANVYCCPLLTSLPPGAVLQDPVAAKGVDCFLIIL